LFETQRDPGRFSLFNFMVWMSAGSSVSPIWKRWILEMLCQMLSCDEQRAEMPEKILI
jgi:hypothetical protein